MNTRTNTMLFALSLLLSAPAWADDVDEDGADESVDCDDNDPFRSPDFTDDDCNNLDDDCDGTVDENCPCEVRFNYDAMYMFCTDTMNWQDYEDYCNSFGANLTTVNAAGQHLWLRGQVESINDSAHWIGLSRDEQGDFVWSDGSDGTYRRWNSTPTSPNECTRLSGGNWLVTDCNSTYPGICRLPCEDGWFVDDDGDGYGVGNSPAACGAPPPGASLVGGDCDDIDPAINPGMPELCDDLGVDENCNGSADADDPESTAEWYALDGDGDGYGDDATAIRSCDPPGGGFVPIGDCDDTTALISPDTVSDLCNGVDDDCNGTVDDDCSCTVGFHDDRAYFFCETIANWATASITCGTYDGALVTIDDWDENAFVCDTARSLDENDVWWIGLSDLEDEGEWLWSDGSTSLFRGWDGWPANEGPVNENQNCAVIANGPDRLWNDYNCALSRYYICEVGCFEAYADADGDGFGDPAISETFCGEAPNGTVKNANDCDDTRADIRPGGLELCDDNNIDEDCDGHADDADEVAIGKTLWFPDDDGDGFGDPDAPIAACDQPAGTTLVSTDCDDTDVDVYPGAPEVCNAIDDDCNQIADESTVDTDGDGVCDALDPCPLDDPDDFNGDGICESAFVLQTVGMATGELATLWLINGPPNATVFIGASVTEPDTGPCVPTQNGGTICTELDNLFPLGRVTTDAGGNGWMQLTVPRNVDPGTTVWFQALTTQGDGDRTPVVEVTIQCPDRGDISDADADGIPACIDVCPCDATDQCTEPLAQIDTDRDGRCDDTDPCPVDNDIDNDDICDEFDTCNTGADVDLDYLCDDVDTCLDGADVDLDYICDNIDTCLTGADVDTDFICDDIDTCLRGADVDLDYICDDVDTCLDGADVDLDGICDNIDTCLNGPDLDEDTICDDIDTCLTGADVDLDSICDDIDTCLTGADVDLDGVCDDIDTCLTGPDVDMDSICDDVDTCLNGADVDLDGICDDIDTCLTGVDLDLDGACDDIDNCPAVSNPDQLDVGTAARTPLDALGRPTQMLWLGPFDGSGCDDTTTISGLEATMPLEGDAQSGMTWLVANQSGRWDIENIFGDQAYTYAYAVAYVISPTEMDAQVQWGSDDGADFWLNGALEESVVECRSLRVIDELTPIRLRAGLNTFMWRIAQGGGGWDLEYQLQALDGTPLQLDTITAPDVNGIGDACEG